MRWQLAMLAVMASACLGLSQGTGGKQSDQDALQGVWKFVGREEDGKALEPEKVNEIELKVKGDTMALKTKGELQPLTFKLDSTKKPKHIDLIMADGKAEVIPGIYELTGDEFKMCFDPQKKVRPTDFKTKASSQARVLLLKRAKN